MNRIELKARCHCGLAHFSINVPSTSFPLDSSFCSCSSCRHATGQLAASFAVIPIKQKDLQLDVSSLIRYNTSNVRSRYFCPQCGANVVDLAENLWRFCTGTLDKTEGLLNRNLIFLDDTIDGGLSIWLQDVGPMLAAGSDGKNFESRGFDPGQSLATPAPDERLLSKCSCGEVQFQLLPPEDGKRYEAGLDGCRSCRLTTGFEISSWTSVPLSRVQMQDRQPLDLNAGSLKCYKSSKEVYRYFCSTCGATIFCAKRNQSWIDIAVGLLRATGGTRAEQWLEWKELGFLEECTDQILRASLENGFKSWQEGAD